MKNRKSKSYLIVVLIIALLAITLGYAVFSSQLKITGTASASGAWDVHFENVTTTFPEDDADNSATLTDNKTLNVAVKLEYPGDSETITVDIANDGELDATLKTFTIEDGSGNELTLTDGVYTNDAIQMTVSPVTPSSTLAVGDTQTYTMKFEWPSTYDEVDTVSQTMNFEISFDYEQAN